jgi:hypothetical protein
MREFKHNMAKIDPLKAHDFSYINQLKEQEMMSNIP